MSEKQTTSDTLGLAAAGQPQLIELPEIPDSAPVGPPILANGIGLFHGVKIKLSVLVGHADTSIGELMALKESSVLTLDRALDCPIDVMFDGNVVARGQLVAVDDNFGVRITEIAPQTKP